MICTIEICNAGTMMYIREIIACFQFRFGYDVNNCVKEIVLNVIIVNVLCIDINSKFL